MYIFLEPREKMGMKGVVEAEEEEEERKKGKSYGRED